MGVSKINIAKFAPKATAKQVLESKVSRKRSLRRIAGLQNEEQEDKINDEDY